uniref:Tctex1 domain containing 1 n=1 Tax=Bubo bubo TaxID=30461 RepID=A0A8C0EMD8_BUBBB
PPRRFPVAAVDDILKDVLGSCLREQPYMPPVRRAGGVCRRCFRCCSSKIVIARAQYCSACTCLSQKAKSLSIPCKESSALVSKRVFLLQVIKARVKDLMIPRYKIVVVTHIGQLNEQSMQIASRCLWDPVSDTFSSYVFKNTSLFALANVYAVYFE